MYKQDQSDISDLLPQLFSCTVIPDKNAWYDSKVRIKHFIQCQNYIVGPQIRFGFHWSSETINGRSLWIHWQSRLTMLQIRIVPAEGKD
jgi:hypothetical protein